MAITKLELKKVVVDKSIYPRSGVSDLHVAKMVAAMQVGEKLPPIVVEAKTLRLVDGFHRIEAYKKAKFKTIDTIQKVYASEADLYADSIRLNVSHGQPLDQYSIRNAIVRLSEYGYTRDKISEVVRLPSKQIEKITRGFAFAQDGKPVALKGGLSHLKGQALTTEQLAVNRHYSGGKAIFYVRQICELFENQMWPDNNPDFAAEMDRLVNLWLEAKKANREKTLAA